MNRCQARKKTDKKRCNFKCTHTYCGFHTNPASRYIAKKAKNKSGKKPVKKTAAKKTTAKKTPAKKTPVKKSQPKKGSMEANFKYMADRIVEGIVSKLTGAYH